MTREELVAMIYEDNTYRSCQSEEIKCELEDAEINTQEYCKKCAERLLTEYEDKIRADEREKVFKIIEKRLNDETTITFDLPVEEILGDDIDMDDFLMLAEEIVQKYKSLIFAKLREAKEQSNAE